MSKIKDEAQNLSIAVWDHSYNSIKKAIETRFNADITKFNLDAEQKIAEIRARNLQPLHEEYKLNTAEWRKETGMISKIKTNCVLLKELWDASFLNAYSNSELSERNQATLKDNRCKSNIKFVEIEYHEITPRRDKIKILRDSLDTIVSHAMPDNDKIMIHQANANINELKRRLVPNSDLNLTRDEWKQTPDYRRWHDAIAKENEKIRIIRYRTECKLKK
jgi:hypothetical protein